jgi:hypothetical protein
MTRIGEHPDPARGANINAVRAIRIEIEEESFP